MNKSTESEISDTDKTHSDTNSCVATDKVHLVSHGIPTTTTTYHNYVSRLIDVLFNAVQCRVSRAPPVTQHSKQYYESSVVDGYVTSSDERSDSSKGASGGGCSSSVLHGSARVAILFSGGVDSAVLAALVDR